MLLCGWVAWAGASALASPQPILSIIGLYNWGTGLLFIACLAACFALAARAGERSRTWTEVAVIAGAAINALVAVVQLAGVVDAFPFRLDGGRAAGLLGNPVHLGAAGAAGVVLLALGRVHTVLAIGLASLLGVAVQASGSRMALLVVVLFVLGALAARRLRASAIAAAGLAVGISLVALLPGAGTAASSSRVGEVPTSGFEARLGTWASSRTATGSDPLLGAGPGRFRAATLPHRPLAVAQTEGPERVYVDAHNIAVEYAVTTGLPGAALLLGAIAVALLRGRSAWRWCAVALLLIHLVEPQSVSVTPLLFVALGLSHLPPPLGEHEPVRTAWWRGTVVVGACIAAVVLLAGDYLLLEARLDVEVEDAARAERLLPPWPQPAKSLATAHALRALSTGDPNEGARVTSWLAEAARRSPDDPSRWSDLGDEYLAHGNESRAIAAFRRALESSRYSTRALNGLARSQRAAGHVEDARAALRRSLAIDPDQRAARRLLEQLAAQRKEAGPEGPAPS